MGISSVDLVLAGQSTGTNYDQVQHPVPVGATAPDPLSLHTLESALKAARDAQPSDKSAASGNSNALDSGSLTVKYVIERLIGRKINQESRKNISGCLGVADAQAAVEAANTTSALTTRRLDKTA